jgi:hypothetical protein
MEPKKKKAASLDVILSTYTPEGDRLVLPLSGAWVRVAAQPSGRCVRCPRRGVATGEVHGPPGEDTTTSMEHARPKAGRDVAVGEACGDQWGGARALVGERRKRVSVLQMF